jgi:hypothetical protein
VPAKVEKKNAVWKELYKRLEGHSGPTGIKVGVLRSASAPRSDGISNVELAAIHEFGSPAANIPERSFIRRTFREQKDKLDALLFKIAKGVVSDKTDLATGLNLLGQWAVAAIRKTITGGPGIPPPLKPATIARKKSTRPLVDTGQLVNSITYILTKGDEK